MCKRLGARGVILLTVNENLAACPRTLSGDDFHQLALTVTRDTRDADNFALMHGERCAGDGRHAIVAIRADIAEFARGGSAFARGLGHHLRLALASHHHGRHVIRGEILDPAGTSELATTQHGDLIAKAKHFAELVRDEQHAEFARPHLLLHQSQHLVGFGWRED